MQYRTAVVAGDGQHKASTMPDHGVAAGSAILTQGNLPLAASHYLDFSSLSGILSSGLVTQ